MIYMFGNLYWILVFEGRDGLFLGVSRLMRLILLVSFGFFWEFDLKKKMEFIKLFFVFYKNIIGDVVKLLLFSYIVYVLVIEKMIRNICKLLLSFVYLFFLYLVYELYN